MVCRAGAGERGEVRGGRQAPAHLDGELHRLRGQAVSFARQSLGSLLALVFGVAVSVLLPRLLGAEARGEYQLAVKLAGLVLAIAQWGIPEVLLQAVAERRGQRGVLIGTSLALGIG